MSESVDLKTTMGEFDAFKSSVFNSAIDDALEKLCDKVCDREPCYTATLTKELPRILNDIINNKARPGVPSKYRVGSCYAHQKPYVKFGTDFKLRCELGDLLVLIKKTINGTAAFNSALFQLKKASDKKYQVSQNNSGNTQLTLYTKWGKLKIDLKSENATVYDVMPHTVSQGGSYMFVRSDRLHPKFVVATPNRSMGTTPISSVGCYSYPQSLGNYLSGMVEWLCGRTIAPKDDIKKGCADDWSKLIWRVIDLLEDVSCRCKGYGVVTRDNGCGDLAFLTSYSEIGSFGKSTNEKLDEECDVSRDDGFGVLFIEELNGVENEDQRG